MRGGHESRSPEQDQTSSVEPNQRISSGNHQIPCRRPLSGWAPSRQTPDTATHILMEGNEYLRRDGMNAKVICGHCSARGHALIDCIWPGPFGDIDGCPLRNTTQHRLDNCRSLHKSNSIAEEEDILHHVLIVRRANKPPILTKYAWVLLEDYFQALHIFPAHGRPVGYPWTKSFSTEVWKDTFKDVNKQFWLTYD
ncbi:hypothetical protein CORC01_07291 [Colletotrichum orchidophilum]|uniref:Uncharacterized protein n=1 Tax=Colletotrichum orchidophilum TaxID=1209926 RepID=A0A1G4B7R6_9PEZI|nr:uncharacterized protein CORC01_07291 [Colletotrichum orchidophilum]OHE97386.1 hypothetical protein CORC01_07291 [Colletotrichum orchidophilum]